MKIPAISDHGSEIILLAVLGVGVLVLIALAIIWGRVGPVAGAIDVTAFLLVLQRIVEAITARWSQRSVDRMGQNLADSAPPPLAGPTGAPGDPLSVTEDKSR